MTYEEKILEQLSDVCALKSINTRTTDGVKEVFVDDDLIFCFDCEEPWESIQSRVNEYKESLTAFAFDDGEIIFLTFEKMMGHTDG